MNERDCGVWGTWGVGGVRCRRGRREGEAFGFFETGRKTRWVVVLWDDSDTPRCVRARLLMFKHLRDRDFAPEVSR